MTDLLIRRARLVPVRGEVMVQALVDVLVEDGTVTQVAPAVERPDGVEEIDADGRWIAPGLWDQHVHLTQWVEGRQRLDLSGAGSVEEAAQLVGQRIAERPGQPVVGWGHRSAFMGRDGTTSELDAVSTEVPILLISGDGHHAWGNALALSMLGLTARDEVVRENEWFDAYPRVPRHRRPDGHGGRLPRRPLRGRGPRGRRPGRLRVQRPPRALGRALARRLRPAARPLGDVRRGARGGHRGRPAHGRSPHG